MSYAAGQVVDALALEYAGQSVVFVEYDVDSQDEQFLAREQRWWDAYQVGGSVSLPLVMVDSGNQFSNSVVDAQVYRDMLDAALARPPLADITAYWLRVGDSVQFIIQVENLSSVTFSPANLATVWGVVYEDEHAANTDHYARAAVSSPISELPPGAVMSYTLQTGDLTGVNWANLHYVALADYRPVPSSRPRDTIQAVVAQSRSSFAVQPDTLTWLVDPTDVTLPQATLSLQSSEASDWTAETSAAWLTVTPNGGTAAIQPVVSVISNSLAAGWQQGVVTFTTISGSLLSDTLTAHVYYGPLQRVYLPCVLRE